MWRILSRMRHKLSEFVSKLVFGRRMSLIVHPVPREVLKQLDQLAHYSIIIGYFQYFKHGGSILDVGCGEGILQERLSPYAYSKYVGIDISAEAINQASHKGDEKTFFIRGDANNYTPSESFDAIVFNESLYFLDDPLKILKRYERYLEEDGIFIISMYLNQRTASIWKRLESVYPPLDETKVTNKSGTSWICKVFIRSRAHCVNNLFNSQKLSWI